MDAKKCSKCDRELDICNFGKQSRSADGLRNECNDCRRAYYQENKEAIKMKSNARYWKNRDEELKKMRLRYEENRDSKIEYQKQYYQNNSERIANYKKDYQRNNSDMIRNKKREYYLQNRAYFSKKSSEYHKTKMAEDPDYAYRSKLKTSFRHFLLTGRGELAKYVSYSPKELVESLRYFDNIGKHVDHIIPQSLYSFAEPEEISKCWDIRNLRMLSPEENQRKKNKLDMDEVFDLGIQDLLPSWLSE